MSSEVGARIRTMARHCAQAVRKYPVPRWAIKIFGAIGEPEQQTTNDEETMLELELEESPIEMLADEGDTENFYGFNAEHKAAWICPAEDLISIR